MSKNIAVVIDREDVLCRYTDVGWLPVHVTLPRQNTEHQHHRGDKPPQTDYQNYQIGCVPLLPSVDADGIVVDNSTLLTVTHAITADYAQIHTIVLPATVMASEFNAHSRLENSSQSNTSVNDIAWVAYRQLITQLPTVIAVPLSQAIQLLRWQADTQFCSRCGNRATIALLGERAMVCSHCSLRQYPRVQPCVITAITRPNPITGEMQLLLAHHHRYGRQSSPLQYGLIAGFVEVGESLEHAVAREVNEEVNIRLSDIHYVSSQPWPYPSNLMLGFRATYASGEIILQEDELSHADFFDMTALPKIPSKGSIAYDLIAKIAHEQGISL